MLVKLMKVLFTQPGRRRPKPSWMDEIVVMAVVILILGWLG